MLKQHNRIFIRLDKTPECHGETDRRRMDRQNCSGYYSDLQWSQCVVKSSFLWLICIA